MASDAVVNLVINAAGADTQINAQLRHIVTDAERRAPAIDLTVNVDLSTLDRRLQREFGILGTRMDSAFGVVNDSIRDGFRDLTNELSSQLNVIGRQLADTNRRLDTVNSTLNDLNRNDGLRHVADDADRADDSSGRLADTFRRMGAGAVQIGLVAGRMTLLAGAAAGAVPVVAGVAAALTNIAPAAAAGVTAFVAMKAAALTLKLGLSGVEDALTAVFDPDADPEKVAEALKNLSSNARAFVVQAQSMKPAFDSLRLDVQDKLFKGLDKTLKDTGTATFPVLRTAALDFAGTFNAMAKNTGVAAQDLAESGTLGKALGSGASAFAKLRRIPAQVLTAIVNLSAGGGPLLNRIADGVAKVADNITKKLSGAAKSGALQTAIDNAGKALAQLGRIASNIGTFLGNVFSAASVSGGGLFGTLEMITQGLADISATTEFQETLGTLISLGQTLGSEIFPLIGAAFAALAPVVQILAPALEELVRLLGDELGALIPQLAPVLQQVAMNATELLSALQPLITNGFAALVAILPALMDLMQSVNLLITQAAPLIQQLAPLLGVLLTGAIVILVEAMSVVTTSVANLITWVSSLITIGKDFAVTFGGVVLNAVKLVGDLLSGDFSGAWNRAKTIVGDVAGFIGRTVGTLKDTILRLIGNLASLLPGAVRNAFQGLVNAVRDKTALGLVEVIRFVSRAIEYISGAADRFFSAGGNLIGSLISGIRSKIGDVADAVNDVVSAARDFLPFSPAKRGPFSGRGYPLYSGRALIGALAQGILDQRSTLENAMSATLGVPVTSSGVTLGGGTTSGSQGGSALAGAAAGASSVSTSPTVMVYLGNELVRNYVNVIVDDNNNRRDRLAAQGVRG